MLQQSEFGLQASGLSCITQERYLSNAHLPSKRLLASEYDLLWKMTLDE